MDGGRACKNDAVRIGVHIIDSDCDRRSVKVLQRIRPAAVGNGAAAEKSSCFQLMSDMT